MTDGNGTESPLAKRAAYLRRLFGRGVGRTPTAKQKLLLSRAALLTARAEQALSDPLISANDAVRLDGAAARARRELQQSIDRRAPEIELTLAQYALQSRKAAT